MKNETPNNIWKRFIILGLLLVLVLGFINRLLFHSRIEEAKSQIVLESLQSHKILSNELHTVFHGVQDDFNFFEKKILQLMNLNPNSLEYKNDVKSLVEFLETHFGYFKVRLTNSSGQELFKIAQQTNHLSYHQSNDLYDLSKQPFYHDLNKVQGKEFNFSSMEANIINGVVELPIRPTVRVSKRVIYKNGESGLLIFNIDGQRILNLFSSSNPSSDNASEKSLLDSEGFYVASLPRLSDQDYTILKTSFKARSPKLFQILHKQKNIQGAISFKGEMVVYSQLLLPSTMERWFLISRYPEILWNQVIFKELLTWIFWEVIFLVFFLTWLWKDEKKRHKDEVVKVLLKERSEFIQNVSHQLKTPLSIMINSLEKNIPSQQDWIELKKEMYHLIKVVEDMLLLAQVDAIQNLPLKNEDLLEIVSDSVDMIGPKAKEKGISIRFNVDEKLLAAHDRVELPVMGELLKSAILNLIDNAVDFSPAGEIVTVFVAYREGKFIIQVKDNGPGIAEEFIPKLYLRFSRSDRNKRKGSGLGLSIAKKIIELHNGEIQLMEHKNGTVFEIRL